MRKPELAGRRSATEQLLTLVEDDLDRAYRLAGMILGDADDARDATQDAVLRAWRSAGAVRDPARFRPWFDRILINACRDQLRRRARVRFVPLTVLPAEATDPFRAVLDGDEVLGAISALDDDLRVVVILHYWADLPLDGVATRTGWPIGTVKSRLHRALDALRRQLGADAEAWA